MEYETNPGSKAGPGASETIFSKRDSSQKHSYICVAQFSILVQQFTINTGHIGMYQLEVIRTSKSKLVF